MSQVSTYCFIINGASNSKRAVDVFRKYELKILEKAPDAHFVYIEKDQLIDDIAREMAQQYSHIIACGGDGTVHLVANGIMETEAVLGVIPLGSGNDFAREIGFTGTIDHNLEKLFNGKVKPVDVVKCQWGYFLNTMGIGADGLTNYYASRSKFKSGGMRYFEGGLRALFKAKPFEITLKINEQKTPETLHTWMVTIANGSTEGGRYRISPDSEIRDGKLEVIVVRDIPRWRLIYEFLKISLGLPFNKKVIQTYPTRKGGSLKISRNVKSHADGEQISSQKHHLFSILNSKRPVIFAT